MASNSTSDTDRRSRRSWRFWPVVLVFLGFILVAIMMMLAASYRPNHADRYVSVYEAMLGWPALAFILLLIIVLVFHRELSGLIERARRVDARGWVMSFDSVQPEALPSERPRADPPEPPAEIADSDDQDSELSTVENSSDSLMRTALLALRSNNHELRDEARRWWVRYLTVYLRQPAKVMLEFFVSQPMHVLRQEFPELFNDFYFRGRHTGLVLPDHTRDAAFNVLKAYGLVASEEGEMYVTDQGRELHTFLASEEGKALATEFDETLAGSGYMLQQVPTPVDASQYSVPGSPLLGGTASHYVREFNIGQGGTVPLRIEIIPNKGPKTD